MVPETEYKSGYPMKTASEEFFVRFRYWLLPIDVL
jgi:hypothetical protein